MYVTSGGKQKTNLDRDNSMKGNGNLIPTTTFV